MTALQKRSISFSAMRRYLARMRLMASSMWLLISALSLSSLRRSKLRTSSHSHSFSITQMQQQISCRNSSSSTSRSSHSQFIIAQMCCFFILLTSYFSKRSYSSSIRLNSMLLLSRNSQISHPHSRSNFMLSVSFRFADSTSAIRSRERGMPRSMGVRAVTTRQPLMWTAVQLGTQRFWKWNMSFQMPQPLWASLLSSDFSSKMQRCILLKSSFLGRGRARPRQCWQQSCRSLKVGWHLQGRQWMLSSNSSSQRQQFSISLRKTMKDYLNRVPVSRMQISGLLISTTSYCAIASRAKNPSYSSVRTFSIFSEQYSPCAGCSRTIACQLNTPLSLARYCEYLRLRLSKSVLLISPQIFDSSGITSEQRFSSSRLLILRQQPLLQLGSVSTARSAQSAQELKRRSSNRQAAVLLQRMERFLGLGPRMCARACSYLRMASTYFLFLKQVLACSRS